MSGFAPAAARAETVMLPAERPEGPPADPPADRPLIIGLALALVFALGAGTQYAAWRFGFHPNLGAPLVVLTPSTMRWLRATGVLAAGTGLAALLVPWLRSLCLPLLVVTAGAAVCSFGPLYAPHRIFVWYAANAAVARTVPIFRVAWLVVVIVGVAA